MHTPDGDILKFKLTKTKLKMEIDLRDLEWLFHNSPENTYDGESVGVKVKRGKRHEFAQFIVDNLKDDTSRNESGDPIWGAVLEEVFLRIIEGYEDFCKYNHEV